jgi:starch phosphorylase
LRFGQYTVQESSTRHLFQVEVHLGELSPAEVRVELYAESLPPDAGPVRVTMESREMLTGSGVSLYHATVSKGRPASDYTPRVIPYHAEASVPLEANFILWHE